MTSSTQGPTLIKDRATNSAVKSNLDLIADASKSFRRVRGDNRLDDAGLRTIWHQGKLRTEMLTWETTEGKINRQELSFFGLTVNFREGKPLSTGRTQHDESTTDVGAPKSTLVVPDSTLARTTLEYASHLLKNVPDRDYYAQHMLKQVNDALNASFEDDGHTVISSLESYSKDDRDDSVKTPVSGAATLILDPTESRGHSHRLAFALLVLAGLVLGAGIGLLLW